MSKKRSRNKMFELTQTIVKSKQKPSKKFELNQSIVSSKQNSGRRFGLDQNIAKQLAKHMLRRGFSISARTHARPKAWRAKRKTTAKAVDKKEASGEQSDVEISELSDDEDHLNSNADDLPDLATVF